MAATFMGARILHDAAEKSSRGVMRDGGGKRRARIAGLGFAAAVRGVERSNAQVAGAGTTS
jgi:hypothetical protein